MTYYQTASYINVELVGTFIKRSYFKDDDYTCLHYDFDNVILLSDFNNGKIEGVKWQNRAAFFNRLSETSQTFMAYQHTIEDEYDDINIIPDWKYKISQNDIATLDTLKEGDIITFTADFAVISCSDYYHGEQHICYILLENRIWNVKRHGEQCARDKLISLIDRLPYDMP